MCYIYESHLGGVFSSCEPLDETFLYCEECGDCDYLIGKASTREEAWNLLKEYYKPEDEKTFFYMVEDFLIHEFAEV